MVLALCSLAVPFALCSAYATEYELGHSLRISKATHIFAHPNLLDTAIRGAQTVGIPLSKLHILEGSSKRGFGCLDDYITRAGKTNTAPIATRPVTNDQLAFLLFSSGTTGLPKGTLKLEETTDAYQISGGPLPYEFYQLHTSKSRLVAKRVSII